MKYFILLLIILNNLLVFATIYEVKQDGSGDFTDIQAGIQATANSDTILVYPGTYYENINYLGKTITVGSLYLLEADEDYKYNTVINGNRTGSCVRAILGEAEGTRLVGFTLTNGSGSPSYEGGDILGGGGALIAESYLSIEHCIIKHNHVIGEAGGGVYAFWGEVQFIDVSIHDNRGRRTGGIILGNSYATFSAEYPSSIYRNFGSHGCDIRKVSSQNPLEIHLDTLTVANPSNFFVKSTDSINTPQDDIILHYNQTILDPVNSDLYVSTDGDNNNSGLTPDEPLQSIFYAQWLVQPDSLNPKAIYLADGVYSYSANDQWFPLGMRSYTSLIGESMENTILDGEQQASFLYDYSSNFNYVIKNMSFIQGYQKMNMNQFGYKGDRWLEMENIQFYHNYAHENGPELLVFMDLNVTINNLNIFDNYDHFINSLVLSAIDNDYVYHFDVTNFRLLNDDTEGVILGQGYHQAEPNRLNMKNALLANNHNTYEEFSLQSTGIAIGKNKEINLVNCTIADNRTEVFGAPIFGDKESVEVNIYNSIISDNFPYSFYLHGADEEEPITVNLHHTLVKDGEESIYAIPAEANIVNWHDGCLTDDPSFMETGEDYYSLAPNSPCIDAGTMELPEGLELPETDLAGNPRIAGENVDMGCYEFQGDPVSWDEYVPEAKVSSMNTFPNPFRVNASRSITVTNIKLHLIQAGDYEIKVYNSKGQYVKTIFSGYLAKGEFQFSWDGRDKHKKMISSGIYLCQLEQGGKVQATNKMTVIK